MNKYLIRHKILEALYIIESRVHKQFDLNQAVYGIDVSLEVTHICKRTGCTEYEIESQLIYLVHAGEVSLCEGDRILYLITSSGRLAIVDEKYLKAETVDKRESNTEHRATLAARVSLVSTVMGFTLAAFSLAISTCNTIKSSKGIDQISNKLDSVLKKK